MRVLHLYRPRLPGLRAQTIQVVHTCHALAQAGFEVTLLADSAAPTSAAEALDLLGLQPHPALHLHLCPIQNLPAAGLWFRGQVLKWWVGAPGVVLARDKRRLLQALRFLPKRHRIVLETHELDSALAAESGHASIAIQELEIQALARADALVANCGGTLAAWQAAYPDQLPACTSVIHNATAPDRMRAHQPPSAPVLRYVGSLRSYKGLNQLVAYVDALPAPLEFIGGTEDERAVLPESIQARAPVPYREVPDLLASASVLLLPLSDNLFGRALTSPLKLWDYLATGTPIVAADLPSVREILTQAGAEVRLYPPDDPDALIQAIEKALLDPPRNPSVRTWEDRATDLTPVLRGLT